MCLPNKPELQQKCNGGNPAEVALTLESEGVCDTSCIDYSWCSNDKAICTSMDAARHFESQLGERLNENIPDPCGCYFEGERYSYTIDKGSNVYSINAANGSIETFRKTIQAHIVDFGPTVGGYVVLSNFTSGKFTDPKLNGGVYLDRCDYASAKVGSKLYFDDSFSTQVSGLHAVSVMGWGVAKNIQYDNDKYGDVPYWHVRNSWGENWGKEKGYFKMAMYPFNKTSQFCTQVNLPQVGSTVGSMVLIRACHQPAKVNMKAITKKYFDAITRTKPDSYYKQTPDEMARSTEITLPVQFDYTTIGIGVLCVFLTLLAVWLMTRKFK